VSIPARLNSKQEEVLGVNTVAKQEGDDSTESSAGPGVIEAFSTQDGRLFIDGQEKGDIVRGETLTFQRQAAGQHQVRLTTFSGREVTNQSKDIAVESGGIAYVVFGENSPIDSSGNIPVGTLVIDATHELGGEVSIDNFDFGALQADGQITIANLMAGPHKIQINQGERIATYPVLVRANETNHIVHSPNVLNPPTGLSVTVN
jgi:hypothetical protein